MAPVDALATEASPVPVITLKRSAPSYVGNPSRLRFQNFPHFPSQIVRDQRLLNCGTRRKPERIGRPGGSIPKAVVTGRQQDALRASGHRVAMD